MRVASPILVLASLRLPCLRVGVEADRIRRDVARRDRIDRPPALRPPLALVSLDGRLCGVAQAGRQEFGRGSAGLVACEAALGSLNSPPDNRGSSSQKRATLVTGLGEDVAQPDAVCDVEIGPRITISAPTLPNGVWS